MNKPTILIIPAVAAACAVGLLYFALDLDTKPVKKAPDPIAKPTQASPKLDSTTGRVARPKPPPNTTQETSKPDSPAPVHVRIVKGLDGQDLRQPADFPIEFFMPRKDEPNEKGLPAGINAAGQLVYYNMPTKVMVREGGKEITKTSLNTYVATPMDGKVVGAEQGTPTGIVSPNHR